MPSIHSPASARSPARAIALLALLGVGVAAALLWHQQAPAADARWTSLEHDRHRHHLHAQRLAVALRDGDAWAALVNLERARLYPPLYTVTAALPLALRDLEFRASLWPSLLAWMLAGWLCFRLAFRGAPEHGVAAGAIALAFYLASPAHRAFGMDWMLEAMGAAATLFAVERFVHWRAGGGARGIALALTLLFFTKYNFYLLATLGLVLALAFESRPLLRDLARSALARARPLVREPLLLAASAWVALALVIALRGGTRLSMSEQVLSLQSPGGPLQAAALAVALWLGWRRYSDGAWPWSAWHPDARVGVQLHALPVLAWFCLPKRLAYFLFHVGPANTQANPGLAEAMGVYGGAFASELHAHPAFAVLALLLALAGFVLAAGGARVLVPVGFVFGTGLALTLLHPNQQTRYLHSFAALLWVASGIGAAALLARVGLPRRAVWATALAVAAFVLASGWPVALAPPWPHDAIELGDAFLPGLRPDDRVAIVANGPVAAFAEWRFVEQGGRSEHLRVHPTGEAVAPWLARTPHDVLVELWFPPGSPWRSRASAVETGDDSAAWLEERARASRGDPRGGATARKSDAAAGDWTEVGPGWARVRVGRR